MRCVSAWVHVSLIVNAYCVRADALFDTDLGWEQVAVCSALFLPEQFIRSIRHAVRKHFPDLAVRTSYLKTVRISPSFHAASHGYVPSRA